MYFPARPPEAIPAPFKDIVSYSVQTDLEADGKGYAGTSQRDLGRRRMGKLGGARLSLRAAATSRTISHPQVYGDIGELYGAIAYGIRLHKNYAQGSDGRLGNDFVEVKTITPFKQSNIVTLNLRRNFSKVLIVKISADFEVSARMIDRKALPKTTRDHIQLDWGQFDPAPTDA